MAIGGMGLFMGGRFLGSLFMTWFRPQRILMVYAATSAVLTIISISGAGILGIFSLCLIFFFMSIMYPTIFALGLKNMGIQTKRASSFLVMAIVGGAVAPVLMGFIAQNSSMKIGFIIPLVCFIFIFYFAFSGYKTVRIKVK
jgi:MFS transporter, FHS family, L-fucose permease